MVSYLYVSCNGLMTSVGEERSNVYAIVECNYAVSVRRDFLFL